jgi:hypothetical protein
MPVSSFLLIALIDPDKAISGWAERNDAQQKLTNDY